MLTDEMIKELDGLEKAGPHGNLATNAVLAKAENPESALHNHPAFEWDIRKAAHKFNLEAARHVVQVYVSNVKDDGTMKTMRQYVHIYDAEGFPVYRATAKVLLEDRSRLINLVADRILSAIHSYPLSEFDAVVELVEKIRSGEISPRGKGKKTKKAKRSVATPSMA